MEENGFFIKCKKCGKKLIKKKSDGTFEFNYGRKDETSKRAPVEIKIFGSIRMKCIDIKCDNEVDLFFFPPYLNIKREEKKE
jgi:site-specific DNA-adenine methylase